jgi:cytochrome P450
MNPNRSSDATPEHAVAAAVHPDPYPYYAQLVAGPPLVLQPAIGCWVASRAEVVDAVLADPRCRVRPAAEPVPGAIAASAAGAVFGRLVRMNEGAAHAGPKRVLQQALAAIDPGDAYQRARALAAASLPAALSADAFNRWIFGVPIATVAGLLGLDEDIRPAVSDWTARFVACLSPLSTPGQLQDAADAAQHLIEAMRGLIEAAPASPDSLAHRIVSLARANGWQEADAWLANLVGLLSQTYEATAGLVGNSLVALWTQPGLETAARAQPGLAAALVQETARYDAPVQNTRRFVAEPLAVGGVDLPAGQTILLALAAANRDPAVNADPHVFRLDRAAPRLFGFGAGRHACPGQALAGTIATAAIDAWLQDRAGGLPAGIAWGYRPSVNARIPFFISGPKGSA